MNWPTAIIACVIIIGLCHIIIGVLRKLGLFEDHWDA